MLRKVLVSLSLVSLIMLALVISFLFYYSRRVEEKIPDTFNDCVSLINTPELYTNGSFITGGKYLGNYSSQDHAKEDPFLLNVYANQNFIQVCTFYYQRPSFLPKKLLATDEYLKLRGKQFFSTKHYTDWFTFYSAYRYSNPNYTVPKNYEECTSLYETKPSYHCTLEILDKYLVGENFYKTNPYIIVENPAVEFFFEDYEGESSSEIIYYPETYYPCNSDLTCANSNHICSGGYDNTCSSTCVDDAGCPFGMHCWKVTNKLSGELVSTCQRGESPFR